MLLILITLISVRYVKLTTLLFNAEIKYNH